MSKSVHTLQRKMIIAFPKISLLIEPIFWFGNKLEPIFLNSFAQNLLLNDRLLDITEPDGIARQVPANQCPLSYDLIKY